LAEALLLLCAAHGTPVLARLALRRRADWPIDAGVTLQDGQRLFGASKTWRGLVASMLATSAAATLLGRGPFVGLAFAALAMAGDLATSFLKRRLHLPSSAPAPGLDQLPEAVIPLAVLGTRLGLDVLGSIMTVAAFCVLDLIGTRLTTAHKS
jgi:CDP-2,3-bis-(O-geranylgeranyl)-sn-glycerol synthase